MPGDLDRDERGLLHQLRHGQLEHRRGRAVALPRLGPGGSRRDAAAPSGGCAAGPGGRAVPGGAARSRRSASAASAAKPPLPPPPEPMPPSAWRSKASMVRATRQPSCTSPRTLADRHAHAVEEDLVEVGVARHLAQRPHRDARRVHVDDEHGDALALGARRGRCGSGRRRSRCAGRPRSTPSARRRRTRRRRGAARVCTLERSEPAPGSLNSSHQTCSPRSSGGMNVCFCSSLACTRSVGPHMPSPISSERGGTWKALASRSKMRW